MRAKVFAPSVTETNFGVVASGEKDYSYENKFSQYNTAKEIANNIYSLSNSNLSVGYIDRDSYDFIMRDNIFTYDEKRLKNKFD